MTDTTYFIFKNASCYYHRLTSGKEVVSKILSEKITLINNDGIYSGEYKNGHDGDINYQYIIEITFDNYDDKLVYNPTDLIDEIQIEYQCPINETMHKIIKKGTEIDDFMVIKKSLFMTIKLTDFCQTDNYTCSVIVKKNELNIKSISCRRVSIVSSKIREVSEFLRHQHLNKT